MPQPPTMLAGLLGKAQTIAPERPRPAWLDDPLGAVDAASYDNVNRQRVEAMKGKTLADRRPRPKVGPAPGPSMRAATFRELLRDKTRDLYEAVAEQPLGKISDALGVTDIKGEAAAFDQPRDPKQVLGTALPFGPPGIALGSGVARGLKPYAAAERRIAPGVFNEADDLAGLASRLTTSPEADALIKEYGGHDEALRAARNFMVQSKKIGTGYAHWGRMVSELEKSSPSMREQVFRQLGAAP
jgi:hypothetical protein